MLENEEPHIHGGLACVSLSTYLKESPPRAGLKIRPPHKILISTLQTGKKHFKKGTKAMDLWPSPSLHTNSKPHPPGACNCR